MAKKKPSDERTFTRVLDFRRSASGRYILSHAELDIWEEFCSREMHAAFKGIGRYFRQPRVAGIGRGKIRQVEVTLRILPDEETK